MKIDELVSILKNFELTHGNIDVYFDYDGFVLRTPELEYRRKGEPFIGRGNDDWFNDYEHDCGEAIPEEMIAIS